jgi:predicted transcriptional regulator
MPPQNDPSVNNNADHEISLHRVLNNDVRLQIFYLLFFYTELNVSEIAQKIHKSKATISRHLNAMEEDHILESRISEFKRSISPKYYRLPIQKMTELLPFESRSMRNIPKNPKQRLEFFKKSIEAMRSMLYLTQKGLGLLNPLLNNFESNLGNIESADKIFAKYFLSEFEKKIDFQTIVISENNLPEYFRLWYKFRKDIESLEKQNKSDHSYIVFESVFPFQRLVEYQDEENKEKQEE